jgi:hypothetical protein
VRRGLVKSADQYPYSSFAAFYHCEGESAVPIDEDPWWVE